jgi:hypothetical protein
MANLVCTFAALATVEELFRFKSDGFALPPFPGYSDDQWGIKAHNRPWVAAHGQWASGQRVIEPGGAYSRLPEWLGQRHGVDPWIGDDFGALAGDALWSRWGNPSELPTKFPTVTYRFENFGPRSTYPSDHFERIFTVSTLEHIAGTERLGVLKDIHRSLAPGGLELHTIDIAIPAPMLVLLAAMSESFHLGWVLDGIYRNSIGAWIRLFRRSGVRFQARPPTPVRLLDRSVLVESADVVYKLYPPMQSPKPYRPSASLLLIIEDREANNEPHRSERSKT